jgi:hypothetical protein
MTEAVKTALKYNFFQRQIGRRSAFRHKKGVKMKLTELTERLGIAEFPAALPEVYEALPKEDDGAIYDPD